MPISQDHELHGRRRGRNVGVGVALAAFVALVFGLTIVKVSDNGPEQIKGFDHSVNPALAERAKDREGAQ
jgi:hypothetical protein